MISNEDVYRCYSVNLMQLLSKNNVRYFLIARDIKSNRTFWAYEKTNEFNMILDQWIKNNPKIRDLNSITLERMNKRPLFKTKKSVHEQDFNHNIRRNIDSFDCSVNPYLLSENIFKNISEIVNNVFISIDISDNGDVNFEVSSKYTPNKVKYSRTSNVLLFEVTYTENDDSVITFTHKYTEDGEIIVVDEDKKKMMYNLTTGKIKVKGIEEPDRDNKYKDKLYQFMLNASVCASGVTEENMLKQKSLSKRFI